MSQMYHLSFLILCLGISQRQKGNWNRASGHLFQTMIQFYPRKQEYTLQFFDARLTNNYKYFSE
jgi:hypothetical protein